MLRALTRNWVQIALIALVFVGFLANATGLFELVFDVQSHTTSVSSVSRSSEFFALLAIGIVLCVLLPILSPIIASLLTLVAMMPIFYLGYANTSSHPLVPMEYSLLTILMLFVVNFFASYFRDNYKKQELINVFGQYVPPEVVAIINSDPKGFSMEGEAREMSVMFCDVHNFTAISEELDPKQLAKLLNTLFTPLTRIIYKHKGVIDKYMGDAIMAFWGAPVDDPAHAGNALAASFEIQEKLLRLRSEFATKDWPEIYMGIGINTGTMSVGNMGSEYRMAYTVLGDSVNLAARLQNLTRVYNASIIVGEATRKACPVATYRELGLVQVKGKQTMVRIYEPCNPAMDPESTLIANMNRHNEALKCYYNRDWDKASELFTALKKAKPDDKLYDYYLVKIVEFRVTPPPRHWKGEIRYTVK